MSGSADDGNPAALNVLRRFTSGVRRCGVFELITWGRFGVSGGGAIKLCDVPLAEWFPPLYLLELVVKDRAGDGEVARYMRRSAPSVSLKLPLPFLGVR